MKPRFFLVTLIVIAATSPNCASSPLFTLVTIFEYPENSGQYIDVHNQNQMTRKDCETQIFLLSDNKHDNLPFGRSSKWEVIGGQAKLKDGKIVVSRWDSNKSHFGFFCVPTEWKTKTQY